MQMMDDGNAGRIDPRSNASGTALLRGAVPSANAFEATVERLGQSIKLGFLRPGQQLPPERELAKIIGVSRATVRAAIQILAKGGFLTARRGRAGGTFVVDNPPVWRSQKTVARAKSARPDIAGFLDRRFVLETGVCELAAQRATKDTITVLREMVRRMGQLVTNLAEYRKLDAQLHMAFAEATGCVDLIRMSAEMQAELSELISRLPPSEEALAHSNEQHARIVKCIARHDAQGSRRAAAEHLEGTAHFLRGLLPIQPQS